MKIKAYTSVDDRSNTHYYRNFDLVSKLPDIGDTDGDLVVSGISPVDLDCENDGRVWDYEFYAISLSQDGEDFDVRYVCIERTFDDDDNGDAFNDD